MVQIPYGILFPAEHILVANRYIFDGLLSEPGGTAAPISSTGKPGLGFYWSAAEKYSDNQAIMCGGLSESNAGASKGYCYNINLDTMTFTYIKELVSNVYSFVIL